ncbi:MAG: GNAT family N-acetyltransferase [Alphaproteobacteria bacterium]|nr:MAG: GNAT family N-acetyltransferase [Alphaproteobacteria bacterium]
MPLTYRYAKSSQDRGSCFAIREEVFVKGQNVPLALERDEHDDSATHILAQDENGRVLGTARLRYLEDTAKIERVAVLEEARGKGVGRGIMAFIIENAAEKGDIAKLKLGSQTHAIPFYAALGFETVGEEYMDAGIPHRDMVKDNKVKG